MQYSSWLLRWMGIKNILMDVHVKTSRETAILVFAGFCLKSDRLQRAVPETELPNSGALPQRDWRPCLLRSEDTWRRPVERLETGLEESSPNRKKKLRNPFRPLIRGNPLSFFWILSAILWTLTLLLKALNLHFFFLQTRVSLSLYFLCNLLFNKASSLQMIN